MDMKIDKTIAEMNLGISREQQYIYRSGPKFCPECGDSSPHIVENMTLHTDEHGTHGNQTVRCSMECKAEWQEIWVADGKGGLKVNEFILLRSGISRRGTFHAKK